MRAGRGTYNGDQLHLGAVGPAGRRWKAGDSQPGFYSQPALGSPFSWEVGHRGGAQGVLAPLESVYIKQSGPGLGTTAMWGADRRERGASAPAWASGVGGANPRRLCGLAPEGVPLMENRRSSSPPPRLPSPSQPLLATGS